MSTVTIIGAGVIGLSWAKLFGEAGWDVRVSDPRDDLEQILEGVPATAEPDLETALQGADFVQENGPERLDVKQQILATVAEHTGENTIIASSTSSLLPSAIAEGSPAADRFLVGHPYNPPELMPLVEVVPSPSTKQEIIDKAVEVYRSLRREPITLKKEIPGFVGNRLQKVFNNESIYLVQQGVIDPEDLDVLVRTSLGLRWATIGPFQSGQLGGGPEGMQHLIEHVASQMTFDDGTVDPNKMQPVFDAVNAAYGVGEEAWKQGSEIRDKRTEAVLAALAEVDGEPGTLSQDAPNKDAASQGGAQA